MNRQPSSSVSRIIPWLIIASGIAMLPHLPDLPIWIVLCTAVSWSWCYLAVKGLLPFPGKQWRLLLSVSGVILVLITSGRALDGASFIGILCIMAGLKPMEINTYRDQVITAFIAYAIIITALFKSETLTVTIYMFFSVWFTSSVLIHLNRPQQPFKLSSYLGARIIIQALPLMLILFFLFPRFQFTWWGMRISHEGRSGFTDTLTPGSLSRIVLDDSVAFRVAFEGAAPPYHLRYFRGIVFWEYNGEVWSRGTDVPFSRYPIFGENPINYSIIVESHGHKWLFSLDMPLRAPSRCLLFADQTIMTRYTIKEKVRYSMTSYLNYRTQDFQHWENTALTFPPDKNPKTLLLAQTWRQKYDSPEQIIQQGLNYFQQHPFEYSLNAPKLGTHPIDEFLFETRQGYCEHYASAFGLLMRAAGIPARLVGGYLGGEANPYGNYFVMRQSDAHVWVEVFLENSGWTRIDPTSAVAPARINQSIENFLRSDEIPRYLRSQRLGWLYRQWENLLLRWDVVSTEWDIWFSGYSFQTQRELLNRLGISIGSSTKLRIFLFLLLTGMLTIGLCMTIIMLRRSDKSTDAVAEAYHEFCRKLNAAGLQRKPSQGPSDFALMVGAARHDLQLVVNEITQAYILLRYAEQQNPQKIRAFRQKVKALKL